MEIQLSSTILRRTADDLNALIEALEDIEKCDIYFDLALEAKIQEYKSLIEITNDDDLRREIENELERLHNLR